MGENKSWHWSSQHPNLLHNSFQHLDPLLKPGGDPCEEELYSLLLLLQVNKLPVVASHSEEQLDKLSLVSQRSLCAKQVILAANHAYCLFTSGAIMDAVVVKMGGLEL